MIGVPLAALKLPVHLCLFNQLIFYRHNFKTVTVMTKAGMTKTNVPWILVF